MLQAIRDRASGWLAYIIVFLISIPFALWGINEYFGGGEQLVAAEVDGEEISLQAFNNEFQQQRRRVAAMFGGNAPEALVNDEALRENVIDGMVRRVVTQQEVSNSGYRVSDGLVLDELGKLPSFQNEGKFDKQRYEQVLASQRQTPRGFEEQLRHQLGLLQFQNGLRATAFALPVDKAAYSRLKNQTRELAYITIAAESFKSDIEIDDEEITKYYESSKDAFNSPERVKLEYIELKETDLAESVDVSEDELRAEYEEQADRFVTPEQRQAGHILIKVAADSDDETKKAAEERANALHKRLEDGEDFAALASEVSEDALSKDNGGDLGFVVRGDMDPRIEEALFALEEGEISEPVQTGLGWQIVKLDAIKPSEQQPFEEARDKVEEESKRRTAENQFIELAEQLLTLSFEQPDSLAPAADATGLEVSATDWLTREDNEGIAAHPQVIPAAFEEEVLSQGRNSELLEIEDGHAIVIRVTDHEPAKPQSLDEVREEIAELLTTIRARELAQQEGDKVLAALEGGEAFETVAADLELELSEPGLVSRVDKQVPGPVLNKAFIIDRPADKPGYAGVPLGNDDYVVVGVTSVKDGEDGGEQSESLGVQQDGAYGARELNASLDALAAKADVRILQENLAGGPVLGYGY